MQLRGSMKIKSILTASLLILSIQACGEKSTDSEVSAVSAAKPTTKNLTAPTSLPTPNNKFNVICAIGSATVIGTYPQYVQSCKLDKTADPVRKSSASFQTKSGGFSVYCKVDNVVTFGSSGYLTDCTLGKDPNVAAAQAGSATKLETAPFQTKSAGFAVTCNVDSPVTFGSTGYLTSCTLGRDPNAAIAQATSGTAPFQISSGGSTIDCKTGFPATFIESTGYLKNPGGCTK